MADPIKVYGLPPNKAKNSNPKLRLFSVQSIGLNWKGGDLFPGVTLANPNCSIALYACSDHRTSFTFKDVATGKQVDLVQGWWRLDPPQPSQPTGNPLPAVPATSLTLADAGGANFTTPLNNVNILASGANQIFVNGNTNSDDPAWYAIPFVNWFSVRMVVQIQVNIAGQTLSLPLQATTTITPGGKQTAAIVGFDMPETWISSFSGQLGYVAIEKTNSATSASFWSERAWALAIVEASKPVFLSKTPWTFGLLPSAFGTASNPIGQIVYDQARTRLTPASNFYQSLVNTNSQIPAGNRTYAIGASLVNQQSANWCVAAAALFQVVVHDPIGFALRSAYLWQNAALVSEYFTATVNSGALVPPGGYTLLPGSTANPNNLNAVAYLDWMWMMALRLAAYAKPEKACDVSLGAQPWEIAPTLEAGLSTSSCTYETAWVTEESATKAASAKFDKGKAVLMSANANLFAALSATGIQSANTFPGHTLAFSGHLSIKEHSHPWNDDGSFRMALYTWGKYYPEIVFEEGLYEDYLRAFIYED